MKWHLTEKELPPEGLPVLIYLPNRPWFQGENPKNVRYKVAWLKKGISQKERDALSRNDDRKYIITGSDEYGNNLKPYSFEEFGQDRYFGQEVKAWAYIDYYEEERDYDKKNQRKSFYRRSRKRIFEKVY